MESMGAWARHAWVGAVGLCWVIALTSSGWAAEPPVIKAPVNDYADVLTADEEAALEAQIRTHRGATGVQIAVLTVKTTGGVPIEDFSLEVAQAWEGGERGRDDGVLLTLAIEDRRSRLEVGVGLESYIADYRAGAILDNMRRLLAEGRYGLALEGAVRDIAEATEDLEAGMPIYTWQSRQWGMIFALVWLLGALLGVLARWVGRFAVRAPESTVHQAAWIAGWLSVLGIAPIAIAIETGFPFPGWIFALPYFGGLIVAVASFGKSWAFPIGYGIVLLAIFVGVGQFELVHTDLLVFGLLLFALPSIWCCLPGFFFFFLVGRITGRIPAGSGSSSGSSYSSGSSFSSSSSSSSSWGGGGGSFGGGGASSSW